MRKQEGGGGAAAGEEEPGEGVQRKKKKIEKRRKRISSQTRVSPKLWAALDCSGPVVASSAPLTVTGQVWSSGTHLTHGLWSRLVASVVAGLPWTRRYFCCYSYGGWPCLVLYLYFCGAEVESDYHQTH